MNKQPRLTTSSFMTLKAIKNGHCYGTAIMKVTGCQSGAQYPILKRMVELKMLTERVERGDAGKLERPLRVYYTLTKKGEKLLAQWQQRLGV